MYEFLEAEVLRAIRKNEDVALSRSRPVLRERVTVWIKEVLADPSVCSAHCCRSGFNRAGVTRVLYGDQPEYVDVDAVIPPPVCSDCGEFGLRVIELPSCCHFAIVDSATLCEGCVRNHFDLCDALP